MKLILNADVPNLGAPGDIVEVKDGYGRNYLLPRKLAVVATRGAEKQVEQIRRAQKSREIRDLGRAQQVDSQLRNINVTVSAKAGDTGRLFGSITPAQVVDAVKAAGGPLLDKRSIDVPGHLKTLGKHQVQVRLHPEVTTELPIAVVAS
ncbi:50S ribosomal protein L9 [Pseudonocardia sp. EV170527-09]|uniref:50S ribosomal protein L9 n=1 Tax=Pseudonocardia sp. EV170527-09 TaxID=2603411 RepID=UPI0011F1A2C5|nr:50S ribosomal protein L9 [Pseudonocardia sp. EV170527-09]KAA1035504.1 50S ribosomal protein L9 [Pseudonocardia sp. EV170527-09]